MKLYRLKTEYPGSPKLGYVINGSMNEFYIIKPDKYPQLWEEFESDKTIMSADDHLLTVGTNCYLIDREIKTKYQFTSITEWCNLNEEGLGKRLFKEESNVIDECIANIYVDLEDGEIIGEDVPMYGLCITSPATQLSETTSLQYCNKKNKSDKWIWFKSEENRNNYIDLNSKLFSKNDILELFGSYLKRTEYKSFGEYCVFQDFENYLLKYRPDSES